MSPRLLPAAPGTLNITPHHPHDSPKSLFSDGAPTPERQRSSAEDVPFVGTYRNPRRFTVEVVQQGGALVLKRFGRDFPMRPLESLETGPAAGARASFLVDLPRGGTVIIAFGLGPDGRADDLQMHVWALARGP